jgi:hypothetical protein
MLFTLSRVSLAENETVDTGWTLVGQIGGATETLLLDGSTLYVGSGLQVLVFDVSDPVNIQQIGQSPMLPTNPEGIAADGNGTLFVSCGASGLILLDVSEPSSASIISSLNTYGNAESATIKGNYAYIADGPQGIQIADISDLKNPVVVSEAYPLAYVYEIEIVDTMLYAAGGGSGLFVVDISDPEAPQEENLISLPGFQYDVMLQSDLLYTAGAWGGVSVLSLDNPSEPSVVKSVETEGWAFSLQAIGTDLLVMDGTHGAAYYDLSGSALAKRCAYSKGGFITAGAVNDDIAFVLDKERGLTALDFSDADNPLFVSQWMPLTDGRRITMQDGFAYVSGGLSGMHVYDMSNPSVPVETYWYDTGTGYANEVVIADQKAYLSSHLGTNEPFVIFDVSDPYSIEKLGFLPNSTSVYDLLFNFAARAISVAGDFLYSQGEWCVVSVDVSDPANPFVSDRLDLDNPVNGDAYGDLLVTRNNSEVLFTDISDPTEMKLLSSLQGDSGGDAVCFLDSTTLITAINEGIQIVDASNPSNPKVTAKLNLPGRALDICVSDSIAYIACEGGGIQIVDVSNPAKPVLLDALTTLNDAWDCYVDGDLMLVADYTAGLSIYQRGDALDEAASSEGTYRQTALPVSLSDTFEVEELWVYEPLPLPVESYTYVVTSAADSGPGTLREALSDDYAGMHNNTTITFDPNVFSPQNPATIMLETPLPYLMRDYITIDASNAGVVLDGSRIEGEGDGIVVQGSHCTVMGLQIINFPFAGINLSGAYAQIGGSRNTGDGPTGQGNQVGGCHMGIMGGSYQSVVQGNLVGVDATGTKAFPNFDGVFIGGGSYTTVGGTSPGEGNIISGNDFINLDTWADHTRIIGNIIGLDITGTKAIRTDTADNVMLESNVSNAIVGGTTPEERNIISGAQSGIVFSDQNSYQNSVIGNYIGTDITGAVSIPNGQGIGANVSGNHRIGGTQAGEGNVISGNNGMGVGVVHDTIVLGNLIGYAADGETPLPNDTGFALYSGSVIGGFTQAEGNRVYSKSFSLMPGISGANGNYIAGNTFEGANNAAGLWLDQDASDNFIQANTFADFNNYALFVEYGDSNFFRSNTFIGMQVDDAALLVNGGNNELAAPLVASAVDQTISGTTCAYGYVEIYSYNNQDIIPIGLVRASENGAFDYTAGESLAGTRVVLLVTDLLGNTSAFSDVYSVLAG